MAEVDSEASHAESPRFENILGNGAIHEAPSGASKAPTMEEEAAEEEEENPDVHFKRKQKEPAAPIKPRRKQVVKKARRHARQLFHVEEDESVAPILPLVL